MQEKIQEIVNVLDQGYVKLIKYWGEEQEIIESARMSTGGDFKGWDKDKGLLKYLYDNRHDTPFEFVGMTLEVKAPLFVFREWHRHRTMSYNEASARYIPLPDEKFVPSRERVWRGIKEVGSNKQAGTMGAVLTEATLSQWLDMMTRAYGIAEEAYQYGLDAGVPKELARITMPVGQFSTMRVNANLRNWLAFLRLREAPNAQEEIRDYANVVSYFLNKQFDKTMHLHYSNS